MIRYLILDVDGTMTDGGVYIDSKGNEAKKFNIRDGAGILLARAAGIEPVILTGRESLCVTVRAQELGIVHVYQGVKDKRDFLDRFFRRQKILPESAAYLGDDYNDLGAMALCGLSACPRDAADEVKSRCTLVLNSRGGQGAVRELVERLLTERGILSRCAAKLWSMEEKERKDPDEPVEG